MISSISPSIYTKNLLLNLLIRNGSIDLIPCLENLHVSSRKCIYSSHDSFNYIYFPETAVISESIALENGKITEIAMIGNESAAGLCTLMGEQTAVNSIKVLIEGQVCRIRKDILKNHFLDNQSLQPIYWRFIQNYAVQISNRFVCVSFHSLEQRLAGWLLMILNRTGEPNLDLTHEQIADALGTHRPSITKITVELKNKGVISYLRGKMVITDKSALEIIACNCCKTAYPFQLDG